MRKVVATSPATSRSDGTPTSAIPTHWPSPQTLTRASPLWDRLCQPKRNCARRHPRLYPVSHPDLAFFRAAIAGEHPAVGFRNRDIQRRLFQEPPVDPIEARRRCARVNRKIATLRGHGLVAKVPHQHLYRVTPYGQRVMAAAIAVHDHRFPDAFPTATRLPDFEPRL